MKKIAICVCIWKREDITRTVFEYYKRLIVNLKNTVEIQMFVVGSEGNRSKKLTEFFGFNYKEFINLPLTEKQNACVLFAKTWNPNGIVFIGSDDVLDEKIFKIYTDYLNTEQKNTHIIGFLDMYINLSI